MHHNAAKCKTDVILLLSCTSYFDIFTVQDKLRHVLKLSIWFDVNSYDSESKL